MYVFSSSDKCVFASNDSTLRRSAISLLGYVFLLLLFASLLGAEQITVSAAKNSKSAFKTTEVKIDVKPGQRSFVAEWEFTNKWGFPMIVERIGNSCGCLAAKAASDKPVETNKSGAIKATFTPGNRRGLVRKSLHVKFYGHKKPVELIVEARIPSPVNLSNQELIWAAGEEPGTKVVNVTTGTGQGFRITRLLGVPEKLYKIRKEVVAKDKHYRLHITPLGKPSPGVQTLQVRTDSKDPRDRIKAVFLRQAKSPAKESSEQASVAPKKP